MTTERWDEEDRISSLLAEIRDMGEAHFRRLHDRLWMLFLLVVLVALMVGVLGVLELHVAQEIQSRPRVPIPVVLVEPQSVPTAVPTAVSGGGLPGVPTAGTPRPPTVIGGGRLPGVSSTQRRSK